MRSKIVFARMCVVAIEIQASYDTVAQVVAKSDMLDLVARMKCCLCSGKSAESALICRVWVTGWNVGVSVWRCAT